MMNTEVQEFLDDLTLLDGVGYVPALDAVVAVYADGGVETVQEGWVR